MAKPAKKRSAGAPKVPPSRSGNPAVRAQPGQAPARKAPAGPSAPRTPRPAPAADEALEFVPSNGAEYPQILRNPGYEWWRSLAGAALGLTLFLLLSAVVSQSIVALAWVATGGGAPYAAYVSSAFAFQRPAGMLAANLGIATLIPIAWALMAVMHRVRPRWLSSVQPRVRWRYLLACLVVATLALNGVLLLSVLVGGTVDFGVQPGFWGFLVVILLTSPLQAAAEEIFFRGYLMQALGSLIAKPWFGVVVSSVVFALFHGTQNLPLFIDRLVFGLLAALLVWRTGGLEAGIAAHIVNNIFAYVFAGLTTSIATVRAVRGIGWTDAAFDVGGFALFAALAYLVSRRMQLQTTVSPGTAGELQRGAGPGLR